MHHTFCSHVLALQHERSIVAFTSEGTPNRTGRKRKKYGALQFQETPTKQRKNCGALQFQETPPKHPYPSPQQKKVEDHTDALEFESGDWLGDALEFDDEIQNMRLQEIRQMASPRWADSDSAGEFVDALRGKYFELGSSVLCGDLGDESGVFSWTGLGKSLDFSSCGVPRIEFM